MSKKRHTLLFIREGFFYPLDFELPEGKTIKQFAKDNAEANEGTIRVETIGGKVLWRHKPSIVGGKSQ